MKTRVTRPNWYQRLAARFRNVPSPYIQFDQKRMTVMAWHSDGTETTTELTWGEVNGVVAYKRNCFAADLVCVGFTTADGAVEANEQMDGWEALIGELPTLLSGVTGKNEWWDKVAQPPFAANPTSLFSR